MKTNKCARCLRTGIPLVQVTDNVAFCRSCADHFNLRKVKTP